MGSPAPWSEPDAVPAVAVSGWMKDRAAVGLRGGIVTMFLCPLIVALAVLAATPQLRYDARAQPPLACRSPWLTGAAPPSRSLQVAGALLFVVGFGLLGPYSLLSGVFALDIGGKGDAGLACGLSDAAGFSGAIGAPAARPARALSQHAAAPDARCFSLPSGPRSHDGAVVRRVAAGPRRGRPHAVVHGAGALRVAVALAVGEAARLALDKGAVRQKRSRIAHRCVGDSEPPTAVPCGYVGVTLHKPMILANDDLRPRRGPPRCAGISVILRREESSRWGS